MGRLYYAVDAAPIEVDDGLLAHLSVAMVARLRSNGGFALSWTKREEGARTAWISPASPLRFEFEAVRRPATESALVERLVDLSYSEGGLSLDEAAESGAPAYRRR